MWMQGVIIVWTMIYQLVREGSKKIRKIKGNEREAGLMDYRC